MLNGFNECCLSKYQNVKIQNFPGGTTETIAEKVETLAAEKPDSIIIHDGTNDIMNGVNSLNSVKKKLLKKSNKPLQIQIVFSSLVTRKDKKDKILTRKSKKWIID